jgi:hypothetical protein
VVSENYEHSADVEQDHGVAEGAVALRGHPLLRKTKTLVSLGSLYVYVDVSSQFGSK